MSETPFFTAHPGRWLAPVLLVLTLLGGGCTQNEPIELGFLGGLTGRLSSLGIAARNGATLAVEEVNSRGGIQGRTVNLHIANDQQDATTARKAMRDLHAMGVVAVIGPLTSSMAVEVAPISYELKLVTVGPTISTNQLSEKDDYFFRPRPASKVLAQRIALHMRIEKERSRLAVIYDTNNLAHTESWYTHLKSYFEGYGGEVVNTVTFSSADQNSYTELAGKLMKHRPDAYFILASSIDTRLIAQQLRKYKDNHPLYASEWSFTNDLLQFGGSAVEGLTICHTYNLLDTSPRFEHFNARYSERFGSKPSFAAGHTYDATTLVLAALQQNPNPAALKETLLNLKGFTGLQATIQLDKYGDTERTTFLTTINNGQFELLE